MRLTEFPCLFSQGSPWLFLLDIPVSHWYPACWPTEGTGGSASRQGQAVQWEEHTWLHLVGPKLEIGTEMREAVSY